MATSLGATWPTYFNRFQGQKEISWLLKALWLAVWPAPVLPLPHEIVAWPLWHKLLAMLNLLWGWAHLAISRAAWGGEVRSLPFFSAIHSFEPFHNLFMQTRASLPQPPEHSAEAEWQPVLSHRTDSVSSSHDLDSSNVGEIGKKKVQLASMHPELSSYAQHNSYA